MKKLFTLLFTFGLFGSVFAQYNNYDNRMGHPERNENNTAYNNSRNYSNPAPAQEVYGRDNNNRREYAYNDHRYNDAFSMNWKERDFRMEKINRDYDFRISEAYSNRYLMPRERDWQIQDLRRRKYDEIRNVQNCFSDSRNRYYDGHPSRW